MSRIYVKARRVTDIRLPAYLLVFGTSFLVRLVGNANYGSVAHREIYLAIAAMGPRSMVYSPAVDISL